MLPPATRKLAVRKETDGMQIEEATAKQLLEAARRKCLERALTTTNRHRQFIGAASKITEALDVLGVRKRE